MSDNKLELYGGFTAYFDEEDNAYSCKVPWFGREISVRLSGGDYDEVETEGLKILFEKFWKDKDNIFKKGKEDEKIFVCPRGRGSNCNALRRLLLSEHQPLWKSAHFQNGS